MTSSPRIHTPYLRCAAYDSAIAQRPVIGGKYTRSSHPHRKFYTPTILHCGLILEDEVDHYEVDHHCMECEEFSIAGKHTMWITSTLETQLDDKMFFTTFQRRMLYYPAGGRAHAALTIEVPLGDKINETEDGLDELLDAIAWFKGPAEEEMPTLDDGSQTSYSGRRMDRLSMRTLHLPILIHHHYDTPLSHNSRNEQRLCGVSAAKFMAVLGITDTPVYCLATDDEHAYLSACWYSTQRSVCVHHCRKYDCRGLSLVLLVLFSRRP